MKPQNNKLAGLRNLTVTAEKAMDMYYIFSDYSRDRANNFSRIKKFTPIEIKDAQGFLNNYSSTSGYRAMEERLEELEQIEKDRCIKGSRLKNYLLEHIVPVIIGTIGLLIVSLICLFIQHNTATGYKEQLIIRDRTINTIYNTTITIQQDPAYSATPNLIRTGIDKIKFVSGDMVVKE